MSRSDAVYSNIAKSVKGVDGVRILFNHSVPANEGTSGVFDHIHTVVDPAALLLHNEFRPLSHFVLFNE